MNILALGAHPDDVETYCAGTLAKYAKRGHKIFIATATNGNIGSAHHSMEEIAAIRKEEARQSAALIGAEYICLDYDDEMFFEDREARMKFIDLYRRCKAEVVFTHCPRDYNPDHMLTGKIANDIVNMVSIAHLKTEHPPYDAIPTLYYWESVYGLGFEPVHWVDISEEFETKKAMLGKHASQQQWMKDCYGDALGKDGQGDFFENILITSRYRGMQCGVRYAECFRRANDAFRVRTDHILP